MKPLILLLSFLILTGCKDELPKDVLQPAAFQRVQWDLMQADEMVEFYRATDTTYPAEKKRLEYYNQILQMHRIKPAATS